VIQVIVFLGLLGVWSVPWSGAAELQSQVPQGGVHPSAAVLPSLVARVDGVDITREPIVQRLKQYHSMQDMMGHDDPMPLTAEKEEALLGSILRQLIVEALKGQEAARLGLTVSPELLDASVSRIERQAGSRHALEEQLERGHTTVEQWYAQLRQALLFQALAARHRAELPISDEKVRRYWEENRHALSSQWHTDQLADVQERIRDLLRQSRWPAAQEAWERELMHKATVWIDPMVQERGIRWEVLKEQTP
jgi:hypothetical protein